MINHAYTAFDPHVIGKGRAGVIAVLALLAAASSPISAAHADGFASFPDPSAPAQISRDLTMQQAARAGILKLTAKGGSEGDDVLAELEGKKVKGPITVAVHVEFAIGQGHSGSEFANETLRDTIPRLERLTEKELNKGNYKTKEGEPITFNFDFKYRGPDEPARPGYDQITVIDPKVDEAPASPARGIPNSGQAVGAYVTPENLNPASLSREMLHFVGLDDQYVDFYVDKGRRIPLPRNDMNQEELSAYLKTVKPPVRQPSTKKVKAKDIPGTERCDIMGTGSQLACRRISKHDLEWIELQAGVQVEAKPGEPLLNKSGGFQNLAVDYTTKILALGGDKTVAPGISAYCIDLTKAVPGAGALFGITSSAEVFDVGPPLSAMPAFSGVAKLLELNGELQTSLDEPVHGMQQAIWNLTDGAPLAEEPAFESEARALLTRVGLSEDSVPGGLAHLGNPNAASPTTGAVDASGAVLPPVPAGEAAPPPAARVGAAGLVPNKVPAGQAARPLLVLGVEGDVSGATLDLQRQKGHKWQSVKSLPGLSLHSDQIELQLKLGKLKAGRYRVQVTLNGAANPPVVGTAALTVTAARHTRHRG